MSPSHRQKRPPWIIRTYAGYGSSEETNRRFFNNLKSGQTGLSVAFDLPTQNGYDPDAPIARGEVGGTGVSIAHLGDMETLFQGIDLGKVNTSMTINATAPFLLALYLALAEKRGVSCKDLRGTIQNDLMKEFAARGTNIFSPQVSMRLTVDTITFSAEQAPHWNPISVCGYHYTESGAQPHEEIGYAFCNALLILDSIRPKLSPSLFESVVRRISFFINSGIELIPEICKVRAYTQLWPELCQSEYGISNVQFRAGCQVRSLSLTSAQPENNIARIVLEALPVLLSSKARVNALQLPGFREALSLPDEMEQRLSLRIQQILMHETRITDYDDIFSGNPVIEELTAKTIRGARELIFELRSAGYEKAIECIHTRLTSAMMDRQERLERKDDILVGVNAFLEPVGLSEQLAPAPPTVQSQEFENRRIADLTKWRNVRDPLAWRIARERLEDSVRDGTNIMPASIEFAKHGGTVGEWTSVVELATSGRYNLTLNLNSTTSDIMPVKNASGIRIVLGKAGLDGHTNAIKLIALACMKAGMDVIFCGIKLSPPALIKAAIEEDADILGVSCLSGAHIEIAKEILALRSKFELFSLKIVIGGIIPEKDAHALKSMGVDLVIPNNGTPLEKIIQQITALATTSA